jgi:membrane fusion protein, multidrug efflux system
MRAMTLQLYLARSSRAWAAKSGPRSRSACDAGEGRAASRTLTRLAPLTDLGPLFAAQAREGRERYSWTHRAILPLLVLLTAAPAWAQGTTASDASAGTCIIKPHVTVQLGSAVSGVLSATLVDRGDAVKRGQVVARLESSVEQATLALDRMRASNDSAIKVEEADKDLSVREAERKKFLVDQKIANMNSLDELTTKVREGELRVQQAQMDQRLASLTAERSERSLELKQIRSPVDGVVIERKLSAGEYIYEQTSIMTIAQIDTLNVELVLPLERYGSIKVGSTAIVHPVAPVGGGYAAKAAVVDPVIDAASDTFGVRLILPNPDGAVPAGIRCTVEWPDEKRATQ